jgi:UTP--glucose-1-phosphate uridylyltransferase
VKNVPREQTRQYGIVSSTTLEADLELVNGIVEKPKPEDAPTTLAVVGRYILTPRIFHHLESVQAGAGGEIQLTDGIAALMKEEKMLAYRFNGTRYDCGSKLGYLKAMVALGLKHPEVRNEFATYLQSLK